MRDVVQDRGLLVALQMAVTHREQLVDRAYMRWSRAKSQPRTMRWVLWASFEREEAQLQWSIARRDKAIAESQGRVWLRVCEVSDV